MNTTSEHKKMGRPPSEFPEFLKKLRATESERLEFLKLLPGDARQDFIQIMDALKNANINKGEIAAQQSVQADFPSATMCKCGAVGYGAHKRWCLTNTASRQLIDLCDCGCKFPENGRCDFCGASSRYKGE